MNIDINVNFSSIEALSVKLDLVVREQQTIQAKLDELVVLITRPRAVLTLGKPEDRPS